jgi:hypothetical protein
MTRIALEGRPKTKTERFFRYFWWVAIASLLVVLTGLAVLVHLNPPYTPGDDFGYNIGLAGGLLMLSLLLYPLRKRYHFMHYTGSMRAWFYFHMIAGIVGPLLILFHSTFRLGAMNSNVALYSMLLVAFSGIIGRFIYRHIHKGLYGRRMSLADMEREVNDEALEIKSMIGQLPGMNDRIMMFRGYAQSTESNSFKGFIKFATLKFKAKKVTADCKSLAKKEFKAIVKEKRIPTYEAKIHWNEIKDHIDNYVLAVVKASQFAAWEKMFSLWHIIHVPFLYLLVISGVVHVIAVHMY